MPILHIQLLRVYDGVMYVSGTIGLDPMTLKLVSDVQSQTKQTLQNLKTILEDNNLTLQQILKATIYLKVNLSISRPWMISQKSTRYTLDTSRTDNIPLVFASLFRPYPVTPRSKYRLLWPIRTKIYDVTQETIIFNHNFEDLRYV